MAAIWDWLPTFVAGAMFGVVIMSLLAIAKKGE